MPHDASWLIKLQRHFCLGIKDYFKHHLPGSLVTKGILCQLSRTDRRVAMTILLSWLESKCHRWKNHCQYLTPEQSGSALPAPCSLPLTPPPKPSLAAHSFATRMHKPSWKGTQGHWLIWFDGQSPVPE